MALPYFFVPVLQAGPLTLEEDQSKHIVQVLRMQRGERLALTDGRGRRGEAEIIDDNRKRCSVLVATPEEAAPREREVAVGISLVKNASRFEWFLEKATELGVAEIIPLLCARTEKERFRTERLQAILVSAMLQSQQRYLPRLHEPTHFAEVLREPYSHRFIAHCLPEQKTPLSSITSTEPGARSLILIGPEGDFTPAEVEQALAAGFVPVLLGATRLRTETAGLAAAVTLMQGGG
jgi:16S rRNA (uracil1498-N3)-methyltransferase